MTGVWTLSLFYFICQSGWFTKAQQPSFQLACPSGWTQKAATCYRVFTETLEWQDANVICYNHGAKLAKVSDYEDNQFIAETVRSTSAAVAQYWIGFTRQKLSDPSSISDTTGHWVSASGEIDDPATLGQGFWAPGQPSVKSGACAMVSLADNVGYTSSTYKYGWKLTNCYQPSAFVCQAPAGLSGFYRCANGKYIQNTNTFVCDGEDDCGDFSDEMECPNQCHTRMKSSNGGQFTTSSPYSTNADCTWAIQTDIGKRIVLEFTQFNTEKDQDVVYVYAGGKTMETSQMIGMLSGLQSSRKFYSTNNYMIVRFKTDGSVQLTGFTAIWTVVDQLPGSLTTLTASSTAKQLSSALPVLPNTRSRWTISVPETRRVISFQVVSLDLPDCASITFYDGDDIIATKLDMVTMQQNPQSVISRRNVVTVLYRTCDEWPINREYKGFQLSYVEGCKGTIVSNFGYLMSPGHPNTYPNYQTCEWTVKNSENKQVTLTFMSLNVQQNVDKLEIYQGSGNTGTNLVSVSGTSLPSTITVPSGSFYVKFTTSSVVSQSGFKFQYSTDCPMPVFNNFTTFSTTSSSMGLNSRLSISCSPGYEFAQEEFKGKSSVAMTCQPGSWSVAQTPNCEPVWCGQAPFIANGYYKAATGSRYKDTVTYECYAGYALQGTNPVTCLQTGKWSTAPTCTPTLCPAIATTNFTNGVVKLEVGDGTQYGSLYSYTCNAGYVIQGHPRVICQGDGKWSADMPVCQKLKCSVESLKQSVPNVVLTPSVDVEIGSTVAVSCAAGYQLSDATAAAIRCLDTQKFDKTPACTDIDECAANAGKGPCSGSCINTAGSYTCQCASGYTLNADKRSCDDVNECLTGNGGCAENCLNAAGSYSCSCSSTGKVLYTANGTEGYLLSSNEDGKLAGDKLRIGHSCVLKQCPTPTINGVTKISTQPTYHYGDKLYLACDLGFVLTGATSHITCKADGSWDANVQGISCQVASCPIPLSTGVTYYPQFTPATGSVFYGTDVSVRCTQHRPTPLTFTRKCQYDAVLNMYSLYLNATSPSAYNCPIIDCGTPSIPNGALYSTGTAPTNTKYLDSFSIKCAPDYQQSGDTPSTGGLVSCQSNGRWDFGTFECSGASCTDPGTNAGTIQTAAKNYEPNNKVTYTCAKTGFVVTGASTLTCSLIGTNLKPTWDNTPPTCTDNEAPVISQAANLCGKTLTINRLTAPKFTLPTAKDNTGATDKGGITMGLNGLNDADALQIAIKTTTTYTYTATDFAGKSSSCSITVNMKDNNAPTINCPNPYFYSLSTKDPQQLTFPTTGYDAIATDNQGTPTITYSPNTYMVSAANVSQSILVTATATDISGNTASCTYQVTFKADDCSDFILESPINGVTTCAPVSNGNGYTCLQQCNSGYQFFDGNAFYNSPRAYTCTPGGTFGALKMDCVQPDLGYYFAKYKLVYNISAPVTSVSVCSVTYKINLLSNLINAAKAFTTLCNNLMPPTPFTVEAAITNPEDFAFDYDSTKRNVIGNFTFKILPNMATDTFAEFCATNIEFQFKQRTSVVMSLMSAAGNANCPKLQAVDEADATPLYDLSPLLSLKGEYRCDARRKLVIKNGNPNLYYCFPCPYGQYYSATLGSCVGCPRNTYSDKVDISSVDQCTACPANYYTYSAGSNKASSCLAGCQYFNDPSGVTSSGLVSQNGLAPCRQCPAGQYSNYTQGRCVSCPQGTMTNGPGAKSISECQSLCTPGTYSDTGYAPCTPCPLHFYFSTSGATTCTECSSTSITTAVGAESLAKCVDGASLCSPNPCNGGSCTVTNHHVVCTCPQGKYGARCNENINYCESNPCYSGTCASSTTGYTCTCPSGYSGKQCETPPNHCSTNPCQNNGNCQNLYSGYKCLCRSGNTGTNCEQTSDICLAQPCGLKGTCSKITSTRRVCVCQPGFTGENCEINIDECASNPCLYNFACEDSDNAFICKCEGGYSGPTCSIRPSVCVSTPCSTTGKCYDDYRTRSYVCVCNTGYSGATTSVAGTWLNGVTGIKANGQCDLVNYCQPSPCVTGNTLRCDSTTAGAVCVCNAGYSGSTCQHNINECASNPCINGKCTDRVNAYECTCNTGYAGTNCNAQVDNCNIPSYPCSQEGTDTTQASNGCQNLVADYKCVCKPGYTGKRCETNINECVSNPCLHDGQCVDGINSYTCSCKTGWEGERCEKILLYCGTGTCSNGANCLTIFAKSFCQCRYPYFGANCELQASTCSYANPCVDASATCSQTLTSSGLVAACSCSDYYTGDGCQYRKNYCKDLTACSGHGVCRNGDNLDEYECECEPDFSGDRCQNSVDQCVGVTCGNGGKCVDLIGTYYCQCPVSYEGPNCNKVIDTDYDLYFYDYSYNGKAQNEHPFEFGTVSGLASFSVGLWVRFAESQGTGTFFTLYGMNSRETTAKKTILARFTHEQMYIKISPQSDEVENNYGRYDIRDGNWYQITVTWEQATGKLELFVNSARVRTTVMGHATGTTLPKYGVILLGSQMEAERKGFHGYISQVFMWKTALTFSSDVPLLVASRKNKVRESDLILSWGGYNTVGGVQWVRPSTAGDIVCQPGFTGANCAVQLPDKVAPVVEYCPSTVITVGSNDRLSQVTWTEPRFSGSTETPRTLYLPGRVFVWGKYTNTYVAYDSSGNAAMCVFDIYVQKTSCPEPTKSTGVTTSCSSNSTYKSCTATCNSGQFALLKPDFYTCGPLGAFNVQQRYNSFQYPSCAKIQTSLVKLTMTLKYPKIQACLQVLTEFRGQIKVRLTALDKIWVGKGTTVGAFCKGKSCDNEIVINTRCETATGRRKRQTTGEADAVVDVTIDGVNSEVQNNATGDVMSPQEVVTTYALDQTGFNMPDIVPGAILNEPTFAVLSAPTCATGQALVGTQCVNCATGTRFDSTTGTCVECPVGSYQDQEAQTTCKACASGKTTELPGSVADTACLTICMVGAYYDKTSGSCTQCPVGYYQDTAGLFFCYPCDAEKTTLNSGSTSSNQCYEVCPDGTQISNNGCMDCPRGFYRTRGLQTNCVQCPLGTNNTAPNVTLSTKSTRVEDCIVPDCQAGYYISGGGCEMCPVGSYQPAKWQTPCISCPSGQSTASTGSTESTACKYYCPAGQEQFPMGSSTCRPCPVGTYKSGSTPEQYCKTCTTNYVTAAEGATSSANCTVLACNPGYRANDNKTVCLACPRATYQPAANQETCLSCPNNTSTVQDKSVNATQCLTYCPDGQYKSAGLCQPCPIGYYRNNLNYEFGQCELCHIEFVTANVGAKTAAECTIANCTAGQYRDPATNKCILCPVGTYQNVSYQTNCTACDASGQKTTDSTGSTSASQCRLECKPGFEDRGADKCEECSKGYYKVTTGPIRCTPCGINVTTLGTGAISQDQCNITSCPAGNYRDSRNNTCISCPRNTYEDRPWQDDQCKNCPSGLVTLGTGTNSSDGCVTNCPDGQQYIKPQCSPCPQGTYRKQFFQDVCKPCDAGFTTVSTGAVLKEECNVKDCDLGYKLSADLKSCEACPVGQYQDEKGKKTCKTCQSAYTTLSTASNKSTDCIMNCQPGYGFSDLTSQCEVCPQGQYKDVQHVTCQKCPSGGTTASAGTIKVEDCIANCSIGKYSNKQLCEPCQPGTYQDVPGQTSCKSCGIKFTSPIGAYNWSQCISTDECALGTHTCISAANGGLCIDMDPGYRCQCRPGWLGTHPNCTHKCSTTYCLNGGICKGLNTDQVTCDCSATAYEGDVCQAVRGTTTTAAPGKDYQSLILGAAIGGGLGLILLVITIASCCYCFRTSTPKPPLQMPMVQPSMRGYENIPNQLPAGTILRPATRFGGSMIVGNGNSTYRDGNQSIAGFYGNGQFMFYDEGADDPNMTFTNGAYDPYEERTSTLLIS